MSIKGLKFSGALAALQASKLVDAGASFLATLDPKSATEADIKTAEVHYTEVLTKRAMARKSYDEANGLSSAAKNEYDKEVAGLTLLANKAAAEADPAEKKRLDDKVDQFETELSAKKGKVESLIATTKAKKEVVDTYDTIVSAAQEKFKTLQEQGRQAMERLDIAREQQSIARDKAEATSLGNAGGGSNFGISALNKAADRAEIQTQVATEKADALRPAASMATGDADIAAAIAEASGETPRSKQTLEQRLAGLAIQE